MPGGKEKKAEARKEDVKYIQCQVCEAMVKQAQRSLKTLNEGAPGGKVKEDVILDNLEKMCDPDLDEGDWISMIDIVEDGDKLKLVDTHQIGKCTEECRTIARSCQMIAEEMDLTELSSALYLGNKNRAQLTNSICYEETRVCRGKPGPLPKDRIPGGPHQPLSEAEISTRNMMRSMKGSGLSGQMYDREALMEEMARMKEQYGDLDDLMREVPVGAAPSPSTSQKSTTTASSRASELWRSATEKVLSSSTAKQIAGSRFYQVAQEALSSLSSKADVWYKSLRDKWQDFRGDKKTEL